jgi:hypothetical protein
VNESFRSVESNKKIGASLLRRPMRSDGVVVSRIGNWNPAQMCLARDNDVVQTLTPIDPISRLAKPFCQVETGAVSLSRMPMARDRRVTTLP